MEKELILPSDEVPHWEKMGFAAKPATYTSNGIEKIWRCYSGGFQDRLGNWQGSRQYSNCYWVFRAGTDDGPIPNQTIHRDLLNVDFLEANLNAALWNNTFQKAGLFQLINGIRYFIGPIGQTTRGAKADGTLIHASSNDYTHPAKTLLQVVLFVPSFIADAEDFLKDALTLVAEFPIKGRERYLGDRSTQWS